MRKNLIKYILLILLCSIRPCFAFDASPFNTQSAELSKGGWWQIQSDFFFNQSNKSLSPLIGELRYTFFDKLRLGVIAPLTYASNESSSAFGFSNIQLTTEVELYDLDKHDLLELGSIELVDHATLFFNQLMPNLHNDLLGEPGYAFNTGVEWQKLISKRVGFYSELGYSRLPRRNSPASHNFLYKNSLSFEFHNWFQPYIELLGLTDFNTGRTNLLLAPGISLQYQETLFLYLNPIFSLTGDNDTWGFQLGITGSLY